MAAVYVPRSPTTGVLHGVVRTHLTEFLAAVDAQNHILSSGALTDGEFTVVVS